MVAASYLVYFAVMPRHGDPDPGGRRMAAIRPVLSVVPAGLRVVDSEVVKPHWDSCDGQTHGWDPATVDVDFVDRGQSAGHIAAQIDASMAAMGWRYDHASGNGAWYWSKRLSDGAKATAQLLGGPDVRPPSPWDLQASVPAATHPIPC
jgi:hypothetical protein